MNGYKRGKGWKVKQDLSLHRYLLKTKTKTVQQNTHFWSGWALIHMLSQLGMPEWKREEARVQVCQVYESFENCNKNKTLWKWSMLHTIIHIQWNLEIRASWLMSIHFRQSMKGFSFFLDFHATPKYQMFTIKKVCTRTTNSPSNHSYCRNNIKRAKPVQQLSRPGNLHRHHFLTHFILHVYLSLQLKE